MEEILVTCQFPSSTLEDAKNSSSVASIDSLGMDSEEIDMFYWDHIDNVNDMLWESSDGNMNNSAESTSKDEIDEEMKNKDTTDEEMKNKNQSTESTEKDTPLTNADAKSMRTIESSIKDRDAIRQETEKIRIDME